MPTADFIAENVYGIVSWHDRQVQPDLFDIAQHNRQNESKVSNRNNKMSVKCRI